MILTASPKQQATWQFPPNNDGVEYGFENAAAAHFQASPMVHLVRELLQNALDAKVDGLIQPVHLTFTEVEVPTDAMGGPVLSAHIAACLEITKARNETDAAAAYAKALNCLDNPTIPCLSVVDTGTTGLVGEKWNALVTQEGVVRKDKTAAGGSYGMGKNSVFNVSDLYSVIYSTRYLARRQGREERTQGKSRLITHALPEAEPTPLQHIGFYRTASGRPLRGTEIPSCFRLAETGTGVFILGFNPRCSNWVATAVLSVIENYFFAIHNQDLTVAIHGQPEQPAILINHETLDQHFALASSSPSYAYYRAIRDRTAKSVSTDSPLGVLKTYILKGEGPRRTACLNRNGMLITDSRERKHNPLSPPNHSYWPDYAAVVIPATNEGDAWLRSMENPGHDAITSEKIAEASKRQFAEATLTHARNTLNATYEDMFDISEYPGVSNLTELAYALPEQHAEETKERNLTTVEIRSGVSSMLRPVAPSLLDERHPPALKDQRVVCTGVNEAVVGFTAMQAGSTTVKLFPTGGERKNDTPLLIISAESLDRPEEPIQVEAGTITLTTKPNERVRLKITAGQDISRMAFTLQPE